MRLGDDAVSDIVRRCVEQSMSVLQRLLDREAVELIASLADLLIEAYSGGKKVIFFGDGGSAATAQHLAAEFLGRFRADRRPLPSLALADPASLTAIANDFGFDEVFARQLEGLGEPGDVAVGLSTSGNSENVVRGMRAATARGLGTIALTGESGGRLKEVAEHCFCVATPDSQRIQEVHVLIGHIICELVDRALSPA